MQNDPYMAWLLEEGAIEYKDNIVRAERAFVANSILKWCAKKAKEKTMSEDQMRHYLKALRFYIKKKIDLYWEDGIINTSVETSTSKTNGGDEDACDSLEL
jgi:hypothetical protein